MIEPECDLWGESFHPSDLIVIENIKMRLSNEPNTIGTNGKYKGKPQPFGFCKIATPDTVSNPQKIEWLADFIKVNKHKFNEAGATDITFSINWFGVQGNMEFTSKELSKIAELNIPLTITYIFEDKNV